MDGEYKTVVAVVALAVILIAILILSITVYEIKDDTLEAKKIQACVSAGNEWIARDARLSVYECVKPR